MIAFRYRRTVDLVHGSSSVIGHPRRYNILICAHISMDGPGQFAAVGPRVACSHNKVGTGATTSTKMHSLIIGTGNNLVFAVSKKSRARPREAPGSRCQDYRGRKNLVRTGRGCLHQVKLSVSTRSRRLPTKGGTNVCASKVY